ncbi:MAG: DUF4445 domain-containing protein [Butyrivibrio sp.]|nr:DUF4445 domain-containing protein [Butyrivibrio sp.]
MTECRVTITDMEGQLLWEGNVPERMPLTALAKEAGLPVHLPCGGTGRCGGCRVLFTEGVPASTAAEREQVGPVALRNGWRLLCCSSIRKDARIEWPSSMLGENWRASKEPVTEAEAREEAETVEESEVTRANEPEAAEAETAVVEPEAAVVETTEPETAESEETKAETESETETEIQPDTETEIETESGNGIENVTGIVLDLGTTTLAAQRGMGTVCTIANSTRRYGADVISRIEACRDEEKRREMMFAMRGDVGSLLSALCRGDASQDEGTVQELVVACNTTMAYLLMGEDPAELGHAPYHASFLTWEERKLGELMGVLSGDMPVAWRKITLRMVPGISAFVGGDITAGLLALDFDRLPPGETALLLDLGTNGEMAVCTGGDASADIPVRLTVASAAAGPVFEAGSIRDGVPGVTGAICHVQLSGEKDAPVVHWQCIGGASSETAGEDGSGKYPVGLCGSGVLELVAELVRCQIVDETGLLAEPYFAEGFPVAERGNTGDWIRLTQEDIRQVQLGKAAIRAGVEQLLTAHGVSAEEVARVYLAGSFGEALEVARLTPLGLLPPVLLPKIHAAGNTSLRGAALVLKDPAGSMARIEALRRIATELPLASADGFDERYIAGMNFREEG